MTRKPRLPSSEERELLETVLRDVKPLKGKKPPAPKAPVPKPAIPMPQIAASAAARKSSAIAGLDGRTAERLRRGELEPEARLDLHGLTEAAAHGTLATFVGGAHARGLRLVLIVTGKGRGQQAPHEPFTMELDRRARGVLKMMTPRWLAEPGLARFVADTCPAHRRHGGAGALYVYLRKQAR